MPSIHTPLSELAVPVRFSKFTSFEVTEKIHFQKVSKVMRSRLIKVIGTGRNSYVSGQTQTLLECLELAYPIRFYTLSRSGLFMIGGQGKRYTGDNMTDFVSELESALKLASPIWETTVMALRGLAGANKYSHVYAPAMLTLPPELITKAFRKYFYKDQAASDEAIKIVTEGRVLTFAREYPIGTFK